MNGEAVLFNIPRQRADQALTLFAEQTGRTLIFPYEEMRVKTTNRLVGKYSITKGIDLLLEGSGLQATLDEHGEIVIANQKPVSVADTRAKEGPRMNGRQAGFFGRLVASAALLLGGPEVSAEESNEVTSAKEIEEVVVTARRREERMQDVPISITAFNDTALHNKGVKQLRDLEFSVSNVTFHDQGNAFGGFGIRGIFTLARNIGIESGVGVYVDGVYQGRNSNANLDIIDVERIEVLKGPQGTNFGRNTISGAINITTKRPSDVFEATVKASGGNLDRKAVNASVSGPLIDGVLAGRASVSHFERDGYTKNLFPGGDDTESEDRRTARVKLRFTPTEKLIVNFGWDWFEDRGVRLRGGHLVSGAGGMDAEFARTRDPRISDLDGGPPGNFENRDIWGTSVTADYTFANGFALNSITAYREGDFSLNSDFDGTGSPISWGNTSNDTEQFTQEFKLSSPSNLEFTDVPGSFDFVAGVYYLTQDATSSLRSVLGQGGTVATGGQPFFGGIVANGNVVFGPDAAVETDSISGYFQGNWHLTDKLTVTAGFRVTDEKKDLLEFQQFPATGIGIPAIGPISLKVDQTDTSPILSVIYEVRPGISLYATRSEGFKSAGFNADVVGNANIVFDAEEVTNWEAGVKSMLFNNRVKFNASGFFMDYQDLQVNQFLGTVQQVTNAAKAEIFGVEVELTALLTDRLSFDLSFGYTDAEFEDFPNATEAGDNFAGNRLQAAPEQTATAALKYVRSVPFGPSGELMLRGESVFRGEQFFQINNAPQTRQGGFTQFNVRGSLSFSDGKYEIAIFGENLGDKVYQTTSRPFLGLDRGLYGPPRTYGAEVTVRF